MIFLDANVILQYVVQPVDAATQAMHEAATALFEAVERGETEATTSEAVLAEVAFVLASPKQYHLPPGDIVSYLTPIVRLPKLRLTRGQRRLWVRAFAIWTATPRLGFVDALTVAYAERQGVELASFDADFDGMAGITRWQPPRSGST